MSRGRNSVAGTNIPTETLCAHEGNCSRNVSRRRVAATCRLVFTGFLLPRFLSIPFLFSILILKYFNIWNVAIYLLIHYFQVGSLLDAHWMSCQAGDYQGAVNFFYNAFIRALACRDLMRCLR